MTNKNVMTEMSRTRYKLAWTHFPLIRGYNVHLVFRIGKLALIKYTEVI